MERGSDDDIDRWKDDLKAYQMAETAKRNEKTTTRRNDHQ